MRRKPSTSAPRNARLCATFLALAVPASIAHAQPVVAPRTLAPATNELSGNLRVPFEVAESRFQQFYEFAELGRSQITVRRISMRWDGPSRASKKSHSIREVTLRVGVTKLGVEQLSSVFATNLSGPLTTVIDKRKINWQTDVTSTTKPETFGGGDGSLAFPLTRPITLTVPKDGCLAIDMQTVGNTNVGTGAVTARLDSFVDPANFVRNGTSKTNGLGCPAGKNLASAKLEISGRPDPGGAISLHGTGYTANAPVVTLLTLKLLDKEAWFPTTSPACWLYIAPQTMIGSLVALASATGTVSANAPGTMLPLPKGPKICGALLYVQNIMPTKPWSGNRTGIGASNYRTITVGCKKQPRVRAWQAAATTRANAAVASIALYAGAAMRID